MAFFQNVEEFGQNLNGYVQNLKNSQNIKSNLKNWYTKKCCHSWKKRYMSFVSLLLPFVYIDYDGKSKLKIKDPRENLGIKM